MPQRATAVATARDTAGIASEELRSYLERVLHGRVDIVGVQSLEGEQVQDPKGFGYGVPFEVDCLVDDDPRAFVVSRTPPALGFGHDYIADRAWQAIYAHQAYNTFPFTVDDLPEISGARA